MLDAICEIQTIKSNVCNERENEITKVLESLEGIAQRLSLEIKNKEI